MRILFLSGSLDSTLVTRLRVNALRRAALRQSVSRPAMDPGWRTPRPAPPKQKRSWRFPWFDRKGRPTGRHEVEVQPELDFGTAPADPRRGAKILSFPAPIQDAVAADANALEPAPARPRKPKVKKERSERRGLKRFVRPAIVGIIVLAVPFAIPPVIAVTSAERVHKEIAPLVAAQAAIWIRDSEGKPLGTMAQDGDMQSIAAIRSPRLSEDFSKALNTLETANDYFGISPHHLAGGAWCFLTRAPIYGRQYAQKNCPGGSTLLMQVATQVRGGKKDRGAVDRKITEILDAMALSVTLPKGYTDRNVFVADNLPYGNGGGRAIVGVESAALILFGRPSADLELFESAVLASLPKRQLELFCVPLSANKRGELTDLWGLIRERAEYALTRGFAGDLRLPDALAKLRAMPDHIAPAALAAAATAGMTTEQACQAALNPALRTELTDSSFRTMIAREVGSLPRPDGLPISEIQLATTIELQRGFKASVEGSLRRLTASQPRNWARPLYGDDQKADVLAFATNAEGTLTGYYTSHPRDLIGSRRRLGSQSKLAALLAFAAAGMDADSMLCNRAFDGRQNAGGDTGFADCNNPRARVSVQTAFARSMNLPLLDALRRIDPVILERAARDAGFEDPDGDLAVAIAFGTAEASPLRVAATAAAMSRGAAGQPAVARVPHAIDRYRVGETWYEPRVQEVDLRAYFANDRARRLVAAAGGAALRPIDGTLRAIGGGREGEIAKSGTDARENLMTFAKTAVGALGGATWYTMVAADRGPVGDKSVTIADLARVVRRHALDGGS